MRFNFVSLLALIISGLSCDPGHATNPPDDDTTDSTDSIQDSDVDTTPAQPWACTEVARQEYAEIPNGVTLSSWPDGNFVVLLRGDADDAARAVIYDADGNQLAEKMDLPGTNTKVSALLDGQVAVYDDNGRAVTIFAGSSGAVVSELSADETQINLNLIQAAGANWGIWGRDDCSKGYCQIIIEHGRLGASGMSRDGQLEGYAQYGATAASDDGLVAGLYAGAKLAIADLGANNQPNVTDFEPKKGRTERFAITGIVSYGEVTALLWKQLPGSADVGTVSAATLSGFATNGQVVWQRAVDPAQAVAYDGIGGVVVGLDLKSGELLATRVTYENETLAAERALLLTTTPSAEKIAHPQIAAAGERFGLVWSRSGTMTDTFSIFECE